MKKVIILVLVGLLIVIAFHKSTMEAIIYPTCPKIHLSWLKHNRSAQTPPFEKMSSATSAPRKITAIVVGSTGLVGKNLVRLLSQQSPDVYEKVIAISRKKENPFSSTNVPIEHITLESLDNLDSIEGSFKDISEAYCCLGTTIKRVGNDKQAFRHVDFDYPDSFASLVYKKFAEQSKEDESTKQFFLVTSMGADSNSMFFYNQVKGDIEKACTNRQVDFQKFITENNSKTTSFSHIIKPGLLIGERVDDERFGEKIAQGLNNMIGWMLPKSVSGIAGEDVAKAMIQIAATTREKNQSLLKERDTLQSIGGLNRDQRLSNHVFAYSNAYLKDFADDYNKKFNL